MKKIFSLIILFFVLFSLIGIVSACGIDCPVEKTLVAGKVYDQSNGESIKKANVEIICHGTGGDVTKNTKTGPLGRYRVLFSQQDCEYGNSVTVNAEKDGLTGTSEGTIDKHIDKFCLDLDIGIINVPLVPEFGLFVGALTIVSAVGIFFFVRKN